SPDDEAVAVSEVLFLLDVAQARRDEDLSGLIPGGVVVFDGNRRSGSSCVDDRCGDVGHELQAVVAGEHGDRGIRPGLDVGPASAGNVGRVRDDELGTTGKPQGVEKFQVADVALHEADIQLFAEQTCPAEIGEVLLPQLHGRRIQLDAGHLNRAQPAVVGAAVRKLPAEKLGELRCQRQADGAGASAQIHDAHYSVCRAQVRLSVCAL